MPSPASPLKSASLRAFLRGAGVLIVWRLFWLYLAFRLSGLKPNLASLETHREALAYWVDLDPMRAWIAYAVVFTLVCGLCLDGTATMVVYAGALFGFRAGLLLSTVGCGLGALAAFLVSRKALAPWLREHFGSVVAWVEKGLKADGDAWLLTARMIPMVSYPLTNLALGLSDMPALHFLFLTTVGLLPCNAAYVWAGTHLAGISHFADLLSPGLWMALGALGLLPLLGSVLGKALSSRLKRAP